MIKLSSLLTEALKRKKFGYTSIYPRYTVNDDKPDIIILDNDYYKNRNGLGVLGFNLNYLQKDKKGLKKLIKQIQSFDNEVMDLSGVKKFIKSLFNTGHYPADKDSKIKRYEEIISKFPYLKKTIRHYKKRNMSKS